MIAVNTNFKTKEVHMITYKAGQYNPGQKTQPEKDLRL